jgi:hypothetical protein
VVVPTTYLPWEGRACLPRRSGAKAGLVPRIPSKSANVAIQRFNASTPQHLNLRLLPSMFASKLKLKTDYEHKHEHDDELAIFLADVTL